MKKALIIFSALSLLNGLYLLYRAFDNFDLLFLIFFVLGLCSIAAAIAYTVGGKAYGYSGWGDMAVLVFFGWIGVCGSFVLHLGSWDSNWMLLLPATSFGLLSSAVLNVNNIRDIEGDTNNNKITVAVKLGRQKAELYQLLLILAAYSMTLIYMVQIGDVLFTLLLSLPLYLWHWLRLKSHDHSNREAYNKSLKSLVFLNMFWVVLFSMLVW